MKPHVAEKDLLTVPEAIDYFHLSRRKFGALLHEGDLPFLVFYYGKRRLIIAHELEKYLNLHPEIRRRDSYGG